MDFNRNSRKIDVGPSAVYRLTNTLIHEGFFSRDPVSKNLRLGSSSYYMGHTISLLLASAKTLPLYWKNLSTIPEKPLIFRF